MMKSSAGLGAFLLVATALAAQTRAPFTGTVRDLDGKPLGNAQVVCVWQPGLAAFGSADRCAAKADAAGRFAVDLVVGNAYCVWAIGPMAATGERTVVLPGHEAAGGKQMDLNADLRMAPVTLLITGTTPWIAEGPLAVRIGVAEHIALGPDLAIPGDGPIALPPLPTDAIQVALVDGRGNVIGLHRIEVGRTTAVEFPEPRVFDAFVQDATGNPLAGVHLLSRTREPLPSVRAAGSGAAIDRDCRIVATTDAAGRARCRMPCVDGRLMLFAEHGGYAGSLSGWDLERFEYGKPANDDPEQPLRFALVAGEPTRVRVVGAEADEKFEVRFTGTALYRVSRRAGAMPLTFATSGGEKGEFWCDGPAAANRAVAHVSVLRDQAIPHLTFAFSSGSDLRLPDIDLRALRTFAVQLVDATGGAMPCAHVDIASNEPRGAAHMMAGLVADSGGRAEVRMADADLLLFASTTTHWGLAMLKAGVPSGPVRITMQPLATMRIRVVDAAGAPVAGARIEVAGVMGSTGQPRNGQAEEAHALERIAVALATKPRTGGDRTNRDGEILVRFLDSSAPVTVRACVGERRSDCIAQRAGDELRVLTMQ